MSTCEARHDAVDERGASAVEYGLLIAGIAAVIVLAVFALGAITDGAVHGHLRQREDSMPRSASANC